MKKSLFSVRWDDIVPPALAIAVLAGSAHAAGTRAGTVITTTPTLSYIDGIAKTVASAPVSVTVAKKPAVKVALGKQEEVIAGKRAVPCSVTNSGNYDASVVVVLGTKGPITARLVKDANGNGILDAGESDTVPTSTSMAADQLASCLLVVEAAPTAVRGEQGYATMQAYCPDAGSTLVGTTFSATITPALTPRFAFNAGEPLNSSPTIQRGLAITGSESGVVYAVKTEGTSAGTLAWRFPATGSLGGAIRGRVAADGDSYYFTCDNGMAYRIGLTGLPVWQSRVVPAGVSLESMPIVSSTRVRLACGDGRVRTLDKATGAVLGSSLNLGSGMLTTPSLPQRGDLWVGGADGTLYNLDEENAYTVAAAIPMSLKPLTGTPFVDAATGMVLTVTPEGVAYALLARSNAIIWGPVDLGTPVKGSPWVDSRAGIVYFAGTDATLSALRVADGSKVAGYPVQMPDDGGFTATPVVAPLPDGRAVLFAASTTGRLYGAKASSPTEYVMFDANDPTAAFPGSPALSGRTPDDVLVAASSNGRLYGFRLGDSLAQ